MAVHGGAARSGSGLQPNTPDVALQRFFADRMRNTQAVLDQVNAGARARAEQADSPTTSDRSPSPWVIASRSPATSPAPTTVLATCARRYLMVSGRVVTWTDDVFVVRRQPEQGNRLPDRTGPGCPVWLLDDWRIGAQQGRDDG